MLYFAIMSAPTPPPTEILRRTHAQLWKTGALEAIAAQGLIVPKDVLPKKSFKENERFFVQKCTYPDGTEVMVKISAPTLQDSIAIKKEGYWYRRIQYLIQEASLSDKKITIRFPEAITSFTYGDYAGLITRYVKDDWAGFKALSHEEREEVIVKIIEGMQMLPIPSEELSKSFHKRLLPVIFAEAYPKRAEKYLKELVASGLIDEKDKFSIIELMKKNVATIASFPLTLDHGDFHTGNFRYFKDSDSGQTIITLFDVELIKITNKFSMVAAAANFFDLAALANVHPDRDRFPAIMTDIPAFNRLFSAEHMIHKLEERFVSSDKRQREAAIVYLLMRIDDCYKRLADAIYETTLINIELNRVEAEIYKEILLYQVALVQDIVSNG